MKAPTYGDVYRSSAGGALEIHIRVSELKRAECRIRSEGETVIVLRAVAIDVRDVIDGVKTAASLY